MNLMETGENAYTTKESVVHGDFSNDDTVK